MGWTGERRSVFSSYFLDHGEASGAFEASDGVLLLASLQAVSTPPSLTSFDPVPAGVVDRHLPFKLFLLRWPACFVS